MMADNFELEKTIILQYTRNSIQKQLNSPEADIQRLPYIIYQFCHQKLKQEKEVNRYLLDLFGRIFYLRTLEEVNKDTDDEDVNKYRQLMKNCKKDIARMVAQINCRFIILGLTVKMGEKDTTKFRRKLSYLIRSLQIELELALDSKSCLSDVISQELKFMAEDFNQVEYYEEIRNVFSKLDVVRVVNYVDLMLNEKRKKFEEINKAIVPNELQSKNDGKNTTKRFSGPETGVIPTKRIGKYNNRLKNVVSQPLTETDEGIFKSRTKESQKMEDSRQTKEQQSSLLSLAIKKRQSIGPPPRFSNKLHYFKSSRKKVHQIIEYTNNDDIDDTVQEVSPEPKSIITSNRPQQKQNCPSTPPQSTQTDHNLTQFGGATPPRRIIPRKYF